MNFDKSKAMRNAEKYVANGKIRAAISEYRAVVDNDPRDIGTLNMLGDLYSKNQEKREAIDCYMHVAEHYSTQGFSQKAIAIYNKISRLQPDSIEVSTKLAELYKLKGSLSEARAHYTTLAEHYQKNNRRIEALSMWKQIALLDPNNTEVCVTLADSYVKEGHSEEAVEAYGKAEKVINDDPELLASYAETIAMAAGKGLKGKPAQLIERALKLDPQNAHALFLAGAAAMEAGDNKKGIAYWEALLPQVEPGSEIDQMLRSGIDKMKAGG